MKHELKQLFCFAASGIDFIFNDSLYDQTDEVLMASPLGPILANLFIGYHEKKWLPQFDKGKVSM